MSWIAMHYVRNGGKLYTRGEVITDEISKEQAERLQRLGAIQWMADTTEETATEPEKELRRKPEPAEKPVQEEAAEADVEADAPEIDIMDGIVADKPKRSGRGKK